MSFNKTQQKKIDEFQVFLESAQLKDIIEGTPITSTALSQAFQLHLLKNKPKAKPRTSTTVPKVTKPDAPRCMACCWNPGSSITSKQCAKVATTQIDGVHVCRQHSLNFTGNFKGSGKTAETHPFFCQGCSKDSGSDVYHPNISSIHCLGSVCGTIKPHCFSKARAHQEYKETTPSVSEGAITFEPAGSVQSPATSPLTSPVASPALNGNEEGHNSDGELEFTDLNAVASVNDLKIDVSFDTWKKQTLDLGDGEGEQEYWTKIDDGVLEVYSNEDNEEDRVYIGSVADEEDEEEDEEAEE